MEKDKFRNKDGSLTRYALACGYVEEEAGVKLYGDGAVYQVKGWICNKLEWESYDELTPAKKAFKKMVKRAKKAIKDYANGK